MADTEIQRILHLTRIME
jgi:hypothetical protein